MTDQPCALDCGGTLPDTSFVCPRCGARLRALLHAVPGILADLDDVICRQVRFTTAGRHGSGRGERPLPYHPAGSEARYVLTSTMRVWARLIAEQRGTAHAPADPARLGPWLADQVDWLRAHAAGAEAMDELEAAVRQARATTDRPADRRYAGPCTSMTPRTDGTAGACGTDLYAREDATTAICPTCGTEYPLAGRRAWLLQQAEDTLLPTHDLARAIDGLGAQVSPKTIESWVRRRKLTPRDRVTLADGRSVVTYRVGDVLALVRAAADRRRAPST